MEIVTVWVAGLCLALILLAIQVIIQGVDIKRCDKEIIILENRIRRLEKT